MGEVIRKTKNGRVLGWYIRWVDLDGKRKTRASKQPTFAEAKRMLVEIEARVARGKLGVSDTPQRITELCKWVREHREWRHKNVRTRANCVPCHADAERGQYDD